MKTSLRLFVLVLVLSFSSLLRPADVAAQPWTTVYTAPFSITAIYFQDKELAPTNGFIGGDGAISYTTNTGGAWTAATVPSFTGTVTSFTFKDAMTGWAGVTGMSSGTPAVLSTVDGGLTWKFLPVSPSEANDVYYHKPTGRLFVSSGVDSASYSTDDGATFTGFAGPGYTGFFFNSDSLGILANEGSNFNGPSWLRTTNGGKTWLGTNMYSGSWQPVGLPGTTRFFATNAADSLMYRSDDGGRNFYQVTSFNPGPHTDPTGTMEGDACSLIATTSVGVYASIDDGQTWFPMPAGPNSAYNTRFYVSPTTVWAAEAKKLESQARPTPKPIHFVPNTLTYAAAGCFTADTVIRLTGCNCATLQLTGASITQTGTEFSILSGGNARPFCGNDSIHVGYRPSSSSPDTASLHVTFQNGAVTTDTVIQLIGPGMPIAVTTNTRSLIVRNAKGCVPMDTSFTLSNLLCNTLSITELSIQGDSNHIQILTPFGLPHNLGSLQQVTIPIHLEAIAYGTYSATVTVTVATSTGSKSQDIQITLLVNRGSRPTVRSFNWTAKDLCSVHDTAIYYVNTLCDTMTLNAGFLQNATNFTISGIRFPLQIAPGDSVRIPITIIPTTPGTYSTKITLNGTIQDLTIDTILPLSFTLQKNITLGASVTPSTADFGLTSTCDSSREMTMVFTNTLCFPITLSNLAYSIFGDSSYTIVRNIAKGRVLQPGEKDSIVIHFWPKRQVNNGESGTLRVTYTYKDQTNSVAYAILGVGSDKVTLSLQSTTLDYDSLNRCDTKELQTTLTNGPCSPAVITAINVLSGTGFTIVKPKVGDIVPTGNSIPVVVDFAPGTQSGTVTGAVQFLVGDQSGQVAGNPDTLHFAAIVRNATRSLAISAPIVLDTLLACDSIDESITVTNNGTCDNNMEVSAITPSTPGVTVLGPALPFKIALGQTMTARLRISPRGVLAPIAGNVRISFTPDATVDGPTDTTINYDVPVKSCSVANSVMTLDVPSSTFNTKNCTIKEEIFRIYDSAAAGSVTSITIDQTPASKFSNPQLLNGATLPATLQPGDTLKFAIDYDPDQAGSDSVYLNVTSSVNGTQRVRLIGQAKGAPSDARLGIQAASGASTLNLTPSTTTITDFNIVMRDPVAASLGMTSTRFVVKYDKNILTKVKLTPAAGWSVTNDGGTEGALDLTFNYSGGDIAANAQVATISMMAALADSTSTPVTIEQTHFNPQDAKFERCTLSASSAGDVVTVNVGISCSDSLMLRKLRGQTVISGLTIQPNPVHQIGVTSALNFALNLDANRVTIDLVDLSGQSIAVISNGAMKQGSYSLPISADNLSEGTYFVRLNVDGQQIVHKFIVQKN